MPLHPTKTHRERILAIGGSGAGKTSMWLRIANWAMLTKSDARFYVLDTDDAVEAMVEEEYPKLGPFLNDEKVTVDYSGMKANVWKAEGPNITLFRVTPDEWPNYMAGLNYSLENIVPKKDWLVVDLLSYAWGAAQTFFTDQVYQKDRGAYFLDLRRALEADNKEAKKKSYGGFEGRKDWPVINSIYNEFSNGFAYKHQGHVFCTATVESIGETDDKAVKAMFSTYGVKPGGQKHTPFLYHTILWAQKPRPNSTPTLTTLKDRGRQQFDAEPFEDFVKSYLRPVAGWSL